MTAQETKRQDNDEDGRNWLVLIGGLAVLAVIGGLLIGGFNPGEKSAGAGGEVVVENEAAQVSLPAGGPPLAVGERPYDFTLQDLQGNSASLHEFIGQPLIINYWASWCGPCRIEMPHLQHSFEARQANGLALLALNQDETAPEVASFFDEFGLTFTPLLDAGSGTAENYGVGRILPTTFFINGEGVITAVHRGPMTQEQIDGYLADTIPAS